VRRADLPERQVVSQAKKPGLHWVSRNLYLDTTSGVSWVFRFLLHGQARAMGLGAYPDITLAEAREKARLARRLVKEGVDPIEERRVERAAARLERAKTMTFRQCAEGYVRAHSPGWKNAKHAAQWPSTLAAYVYPVFGDLPVQAVDIGLIMRALEPIWTEKTETASRVRGRIEAVLDWATARGHRQGENPARWKGHLDKLLSAPTKAKQAARRENGRGAHHTALPYAELPEFMAELRQQDGVAARAFEFTILTVARTGEVIGAKWSEIDLVERLWVVPADRMKAGKEHRVPLCDRAVEILEEMQKLHEGDFVFPGGKAGRPLSNMAFLMLLRRRGRGDLTAHGFRSTFSDWCAERTGFSSEVREMALAHAVLDKVEAAYRRGDLFDKRRQLAEAWARFCATPAIDAGVVPLLRSVVRGA
jgi:integrase